MPLRLRTQIQAASQNTRNNNNNTTGQPDEVLEELDFASATEQLQAQRGLHTKRGKRLLFMFLFFQQCFGKLLAISTE